MKAKEGKNKLFYVLLWIACAAFLLVFFTRIHRIGVFDSDDWTYIGYARDALPNAKAWNPTRVFPEIFMPAVGAVAAFVVTPLTGDYLNSIALTCAVVYAACIASYILFFTWSANRAFQLNKWQTAVCALFFMTAHFWIFRVDYEANTFLFFSRNLTCIFYYTIPTLCNAALVFLFEERPKFWDEISVGAKGGLLLVIYLAVYSNMFSSIVLVAYCGVVILQRVVWAAIRKKNRVCFMSGLRDNLVYVGIIGIWLISLMFELNGGRAESVGTTGGIEGLRSAAHYLADSFADTNSFFRLFAIVTGMLALAVAIYETAYRGKDTQRQKFLGKEFRFLLAAAVTALYQVLLCGVTSLSDYLNCADVQISIYLFLLASLFYAACYVLKRIPLYEALLPVVLCVAVFNCNTQGKTYQDLYMRDVPEKTATAISRDIYQQVVDADQRHLTKMDLYVPSFGNQGDNWPLANYLGEIMSRTLYKHGQISRPIEITVVLDQEKNELYGIDASAD